VSVTITLNGDPREVAHGATVADLVAELGRHPRTVAVEHNGDILPRDRYATTPLAPGDRLEVVHFVQGG
jgi:thiamine biosynthesis protein ThiS